MKMYFWLNLHIIEFLLLAFTFYIIINLFIYFLFFKGWFYWLLNWIFSVYFIMNSCVSQKSDITKEEWDYAPSHGVNNITFSNLKTLMCTT